MGLPARTHIVYFQQNPVPKELEVLLGKLTGLSLCFEEIEPTLHTPAGIEIWHQKRPKDSIIIDWISDQTRICVRVWSETLHINYLEASTLYLLKQLGGRIKDDYPLPVWAGKSWADAWPRSPLARMKAWWNGTLPA
jgi:hypothetical protein